jgi:hypothetical protein
VKIAVHYRFVYFFEKYLEKEAPGIEALSFWTVSYEFIEIGPKDLSEEPVPPFVIDT